MLKLQFDWYINDTNSSYDELLKKAETASLYNGRILNMLIVVFKRIFVSTYPKYLKDLFTLRNSKYLLRGKNILTLPEPRITSYGLESIKYEAVKYWNSLSDSIRTTTSLKVFKKAIKKHKCLEF